jgi:hypothetical protein
MEIDCSGLGVTWSSIEMNHNYDKVVWRSDKSGIPRFKFLTKDDEF